MAVLLHNYPSRNSRIGNGVGLDAPESAVRLLRELAAHGYGVAEHPQSGDALIAALLAGVTHAEDDAHPERLASAPLQLPLERYLARFAELPDDVQQAMRAHWGEPPGGPMCTPRGFPIPGLALGNVFVGIQPPRGFGVDRRAIFHSPDLPPPHFYLAYYQWIRDVFGAHAVIHLGKHGNLEWLPGKGIGLSSRCYPEVALGALPNIYPFIVNNPGEGTQAKRRTHAVIVDHLIPVMTRADSYGALLKLEQLADEYAQVSDLDPVKRPRVAEKILEVIRDSSIYRDLAYERPPAKRISRDSCSRSTAICARSRSRRSATGCTCSASYPRVSARSTCSRRSCASTRPACAGCPQRSPRTWASTTKSCVPIPPSA